MKFHKNIYNYLGICLILLVSLSNANGQRYFDERYIYAHAAISPVLINPGATGFHGGHQILANYRNKWSSFPGAPKTGTLSYDGAVARNLGFGFLVMQDSYGALRTSKAQISFGYTIVGAKNKVGFGLSTEYIKHSLASVGSEDPLINREDPIYINRASGTSYLDASFGVYGTYDEKFTYGIALPSLISSRTDNKTVDEKREIGFIMNVGYIFKAHNGDLSVQPSMFVKKLNKVPTHVDLNLRMGFLQDALSAGIFYSVGADNRLGFLIGFGVDQLKFDYSYNVTNQDFGDYNNGSHEITARYLINKK